MFREYSGSLYANHIWPGEGLCESHTCAIFIHHGHCLPVVVEDQIQDRPADSRIIGVEVDVKHKTKARYQLRNKAMKIKLTIMLRGKKERIDMQS